MSIIHLIDSKEKYQENVQTFLNKQSDLKDDDYKTLSIFGCQSSGKSTLLNALFGTQFEVMNEQDGYTQTTQGIYLQVKGNILILDVEGTDSIERQKHGESGQAFERRVSLFSLAVSEMMIINMWMKDINRFQAANYSLLKTVFELNLQLFYQSGKSKTLLYFVIRDYDGKIPQEVLQGQIVTNLEKIWEKLMKPKDQQEVKIGDLFDLEFVFLPHPHFQSEKFDAKISELKPYFDPKADKFIIKKEYSKAVPIDGFEHYTRGIWKSIMENKDLDIPAQKEILAHYRCREIGEELQKEFNKNHFGVWSDSVKKATIVAKLGPDAKTAIIALIKKFESMTSLYSPQVVKRVCSTLERDLKNRVYQNLFLVQLGHQKKKITSSFRAFVNKQIKDAPDQILPSFNENMESFKRKFGEEFESFVRETTYPGELWDISSVSDDLNQSFQQHIDATKTQQLAAIAEQESNLLKLELKKLLTHKNSLLHNPTETFWKDLKQATHDVLSNRQKTYEKRLSSYECTEEEIEGFLEALEKVCGTEIHSILLEHVTYIETYLSNQFDELFKKEAELEEVYELAFEKSLRLVELFFVNKLRHEDDLILFDDDMKLQYPSKVPEEAILLSKSECMDLVRDFTFKCKLKLKDAKYEAALRSQNQSKIPWWMWLVLLVLGWNEIMMVLRNPFYLLLGIVLFTVFGWAKLKRFLEKEAQEGDFSWLLLPALTKVNQFNVVKFDLAPQQQQEDDEDAQEDNNDGKVKKD